MKIFRLLLTTSLDKDIYSAEATEEFASRFDWSKINILDMPDNIMILADSAEKLQCFISGWEERERLIDIL